MLYRADPNVRGISNATSVDTDPASDFGDGIIFFPNAGFSGDAVVTADLIQITHYTDEASGIQRDEVVVKKSATATIHVDDLHRLKLTPPQTRLPFGGSVGLVARLEAPDNTSSAAGGASGSAVTATRYEWLMGGLAGAGELISAPDSASATFNAFSEEAVFTVSVKVIETRADGSEVINGPAKAVIHVERDLRTVHTFGYFVAEDSSQYVGCNDPTRHCVRANVYFPRIQKAISYSVVVVGFNDPAAYGDHHAWGWQAGENGSISDPAVHAVGSEFVVGLAGGSGPIESYGETVAYYTTRFAGIRVLVSAVVDD